MINVIARGKRKRISLKTRNEAEAKCRAYTIGSEGDAPVRSRRVMLYEFLDPHREHTIKLKRESTRKNDQYIIGKLKAYFKTDRDIRSITVDEAEEVVDCLRDGVNVLKDKTEVRLTEY